MAPPLAQGSVKAKPLISVIVPFYNEEACLEACLASLKTQRFKSFELLPVDDGSTDASAEIARAFAKPLVGGHKGPGAARNRAARLAKGKILVFVDADMTAAPDFLEKITAPIRAGKEDGCFVLDELVSNPQNRWSRAWSQAHRLPPGRRIPESHPSRANIYRAILRSKFLAAGGQNEARGVGEDEMQAPGLKPALGVKKAVLYHKNPDSLPETWLSARWFGRGKASYLGGAAWLGMLLRHSPPRSLLAAVWGGLRLGSPFFTLFKLIFDAAVFYGLWEGRLTGRIAR
jgi:glycosyltransferase involved in cell wall biosynthesis